KIAPRAIKAALEQAGVSAGAIDHFIFPSVLAKMDAQVARTCGIDARAVVDNLGNGVGDTGVPHGLLLLSHVLERAKPGELVLTAQFGNGAQALVFRVTDAIQRFRPAVGVSKWLARGVSEERYTKFLAFNRHLELERGMRGEQDKKTALTTLYRNKSAVLG